LNGSVKLLNKHKKQFNQ